MTDSIPDVVAIVRASRDGKINGQIGKRLIGAFLHSGQAAYLDTFAALDSPVSRVAILRYTPWIVASQNRDGSWGDEPHKDITTLCVLHALVSAEDCLPPGLRL